MDYREYGEGEAGMKVKDVINKLSQFNPELEVVLFNKNSGKPAFSIEEISMRERWSEEDDDTVNVIYMIG